MTGALLDNVVWFGRLLRASGLGVTPEDTRLFATSLDRIGLSRRADVRDAGRTILVRRRSEIPIYEAAFDLFWRRGTAVGESSPALPRIRSAAWHPSGEPAPPAPALTPAADSERVGRAAAASAAERLRTIDFAELTPAEARDAAALVASLTPRLPLRPSRRHRLARRGRRLAPRTMVRRSLGTGGEPLVWRWRRRDRRLRPVVLVCDISGSMEAYTRFLLRFAHALARTGAPLEVFVFGTSLTRITRELRQRDADAALRRVAARVSDWNGGTRIGASLHELNRRWVRRTVRSGAVVLVMSDGWERDDPARLAREMATLRRSCHRLIWLDPLAGHPGFEPATAGLLAALPFVDDFLPCGTVASLEELGVRIGRMDG